MQRIEVSEGVSVGGQPSRMDVEQLVRDGFQGLINLRTAEENDNPTSSRDEGIHAQEHGMVYLNLPVSPDAASEALVDDFLVKLSLMPRPVFVHSGTGERAGALALVDRAVREHWSGDETVQNGEALGIHWGHPKLRDLVREYVDAHDDASA